jgi:hypothetical protein
MPVVFNGLVRRHRLVFGRILHGQIGRFFAPKDTTPT